MFFVTSNILQGIFLVSIAFMSSSAAVAHQRTSTPQVYPPVSPLNVANHAIRQIRSGTTHARLPTYSDRQGEAAVNFEVDVLGIGEAIAGSINSAQNRDGFVKNLMYTAYYSADSMYNVMVFNLSVDHDSALSGVKLYGSAEYDGVVFGVWVFECGTFENKGDGGFINWAFIGSFDRDEGHVSFDC